MSTHFAPADGSGLTRCCRRPPLELSRDSRLTNDRAEVTCPMTACDDLLDFGEWWFACSLQKGHDGPHVASSDAEPPLDAWRIEWRQTPAAVQGVVL